MKGEEKFMKDVCANKKTHIAILILLTFIVYLPSFKDVWQYDDLPVIVNNEGIRDGVVNPDFFKENTFFRSLTYMSFAVITISVNMNCSDIIS